MLIITLYPMCMESSVDYIIFTTEIAINYSVGRDIVV